jgi:choline/glycine/proline betaine transport protein
MWFSIFGNTALHLIMNEGYHTLIGEVQMDHAIALFKLFEALPFTSVTSFFTVCLIITFFVTSSDSGSLVMDSLAAGGATHTPVWQRVFWASAAGVVASALLLAGGLRALQSMTVTSALPFCFIMIIAAIGMWRALVIEGHHNRSLETGVQQRLSGTSGRSLWRRRLEGLINFPAQAEVWAFMTTTVNKAMHRVERELIKLGWDAQVQLDEAYQRIYLSVRRQDQVDFIYEVRMLEHLLPNYAYPEMPDEETQRHYYKAELFLRRGGQSYDIYGFDQQDIITDILNQFEKHLHFLNISPGTLPWRMEEHDDHLSAPLHPKDTGEKPEGEPNNKT